MHSELEEYLSAIARDARYSIDAILKTSPYETTEVVFLMGANGSKQGPMIRKRFAVMPDGSCMGKCYERIWQAQREGQHFSHLPRIFECYATEDAYVVVMEYIFGETLADVIYRCDPSPHLAAQIFPDICSAVMELHERFETPIIHRDLKPSNVMVSRTGAVTLIDFGIARTFNEEAETDTHHFGTRSYAPPEQFGFGQTDVRSDVYALGMLLYYCLSERNPTPRMAGTEFEDVPSAFRPVLKKATAFDPQDRYASVRELRDAFGGAMSALQGKGAPVSAVSCVSGLSWKTALSFGIGVVWDVCVILMWMICIAAAIDTVLHPPEGLENSPVIYDAIIMFGVSVLCCGAIAFALLDKRLLRKALAKRFPAFAHAPTKRILLVCLLVFVSGIAIVFIAMLIGALLTTFMDLSFAALF